MRAASTGGGLLRLVVIWLVVFAALVMTTAGASTMSAAAAAAAAAATAAASADTITATATVAATVTAAAHKVAPPPPPPPPTTTTSATAANGGAPGTQNVTVCNNITHEMVVVSLRKPGSISEGPGPPWCPAARSCVTNRSDNNNNNNNNNNDNINNYNNYTNNDKNNNFNYNNNKNNNNNNSNHQCLEYARRELIPEMCPDDPTAYRRPGRLLRYRLRHCCHHTVESVVQRPYGDRESCVRQVDEALEMDDFAAAMSWQFNQVLARYDCKQNYSAKTCTSCEEAYALWACAAVLPHWTQGHRYRVKACGSMCLEAEQKCPWLLPVADDQNPYAGEAAFTCIDPDIGFQMSSQNVKEDCCYERCADELCVRNESLCNGGTDGPDQRPVCVVDEPLNDEPSNCTDFSLLDTSDGGRRLGGVGTAAAARLFIALSASHLLARSAMAVT